MFRAHNYEEKHNLQGSVMLLTNNRDFLWKLQLQIINSSSLITRNYDLISTIMKRRCRETINWSVSHKDLISSFRICWKNNHRQQWLISTSTKIMRAEIWMLLSGFLLKVLFYRTASKQLLHFLCSLFYFSPLADSTFCSLTFSHVSVQKWLNKTPRCSNFQI